MDRNHDDKGRAVYLEMSLSARRAWIEISFNPQQWNLAKVALRKESVDRNQDAKPTEQAQGLSLSARRAWIEIK